MPIRVPILMYHSIADDAARPFRRFAVPPARFAQHLQLLRELRYTPLTVSDLVASVAAEEELPARPVVLTFDDGYEDFFTHALPLLQRTGFPATLYVATAYVGETSRWLVRERETCRPMLSWAQLAAAVSAGIEIGAHGHTHVALDTQPAARVLDEVQASKALLETRLGTRVRSFAYPYGYLNSTAVRCVRAAGLSSACAVGYRLAVPESEPFALQRCIVTPALDREGLSDLLERGQPVRATLTAAGRPVWRLVRRCAMHRASTDTVRRNRP